MSYTWSFGDGSTGSGAQPSRTYTKGGTYPVTLTVTDDAGQTGSKTSTVVADIPNILPTVDFSGSCTQLTCSFDGSTSSDADGSVTATTRLWQRVASSTDAGASVAVAYGSIVKSHVKLLAYTGTATTAPVAAWAGCVDPATTTSQGTLLATTRIMTFNAWHRIQMCGTTGTAGSWQLHLDDQAVGSWTANLGTAPFAGIQIGDQSTEDNHRQLRRRRRALRAGPRDAVASTSSGSSAAFEPAVGGT